MPEVQIEDTELARLRGIESDSILKDVNLAKSEILTSNPHLIQYKSMLDAFEGSPESVKQFGAKLLEQFPVPAAPVQAVTEPQPPPVAAIPPAAAAPSPPAVPVPPATASTPPQMVPVPTPNSVDALSQQNARTVRLEELRSKVRQGRATEPEARELAQLGFDRTYETHLGRLAGSAAGR